MWLNWQNLPCHNHKRATQPLHLACGTDGRVFSEHSQIEDLLEPLERAIADVLIPSITDHHCTTPSERDLLALPVRLDGLGLINPSQDAGLQHQASMKTTAPLVEKIVSQAHETPDNAVVSSLQQSVR